MNRKQSYNLITDIDMLNTAFDNVTEVGLIALSLLYYISVKAISHKHTKYLAVCIPFEPQHEISNNVVCATSKGSDQPAHTRSLIRAFASRLSILRLLIY